jgi:hypothetical protein
MQNWLNCLVMRPDPDYSKFSLQCLGQIQPELAPELANIISLFLTNGVDLIKLMHVGLDLYECR